MTQNPRIAQMSLTHSEYFDLIDRSKRLAAHQISQLLCDIVEQNKEFGRDSISYETMDAILATIDRMYKINTKPDSPAEEDKDV